MDKLITDEFVRRAAQGMLLAVLVGLLLVCLGADMGFLLVPKNGNPSLAITFFTMLSVPYKDALSPFAVVVTSVIPVVFSTVCFTILSGTPPTASTTLNAVGHAAIALCVLGMLAGGLALILFPAEANTAVYLVGTPEKQSAVRGLIGSFCAFDVLYFTQLLGVRSK